MNTDRRATPQRRMKNRKNSAGTAVVEFALLVPLLLLLALPLFDLTRLIQANLILINISREGANLASRMRHCPDPSQMYPQCIMDAIGATAPPIDMNASGMIYITRVMGNKEGTSVRNVILSQDKWLKGGYSSGSAVWACPAWNGDGSCNGISTNPNLAPTANVMTGKLADGQVIYVVESLYLSTIMFNSINLGFGFTTPQFNPALYSQTVF